MSQEALGETADLLKLALGKILQVPESVARKGTPEFETCWELLDPALVAIYFALETIAPKDGNDGSPVHQPEAVASESTRLPEDEELESAGLPPGVALGEASDLLVQAIAQLRSLRELDDRLRAEITGRCSVAKEAIRKTTEYVFAHGSNSGIGR